jgi:TonB-dependent receptor
MVEREDGTFWNDDINISPENYDENGHIYGSYLLDQSNYNDNFLNEGYNFGWYPNMDRVNEVLDWYDDMTNYAFNRGQDYWQPIWGQILQLQKENFNGNAAGTKDHFVNHYAGYVMTEMKIGRNLHFVPGVRYEKYHYDMNAWNIRNEIISGLQLTGEPVSGTHDNEFFLPMVQLKYKPVKWLQGLFSYTETLKRPGVGQLEPWVYEDKIGMSYSSGNTNLQPEHWTSIDFGVAAHSRKIGLFSVNLFYKKVKDKIASSNWTKMSIDTDIELGSFQPDQRVDVTEIRNHPYDGIAKGIEVEWQTNFWYLPKPFTYFTLNVNYSYIDNKTTYVYIATRDSLIGYGRGDRPIFEQIRSDETVEGPMMNQPSHLFNGSLGFSYKKFETYLSYQYIGEIFMQKTTIAETDQFKSSFHRLDLQARYKLPVKGLELMFNMANITDTQEVQKRRGDDRATSIERYGWTADLGLRFTF